MQKYSLPLLDIEQFKITQRGREHGSNEEIRYCEDYIRYHMTLVFGLASPAEQTQEFTG
jgi:hypothetical protein